MNKYCNAFGLALSTSLVLLGLSPARAADVTVDCSIKHQVIEGFGTCLTHWDGDAHNVYDTQHFKDLYVNDLGCSIIRLDLRPALEPDENAEGMDLQNLNADKLHWTDGGLMSTVNTAVALYKMNPKEIKIIGTVWSPPAWMKTNKSTGYGGNLRDDRRQQFAKYLAAICTEFPKKYGVPIYAVSIQNELNFWESYDSCTYSPGQYHDALKAVGEAFKKWNVKTKIFGPEDMGGQVGRLLSYITPVMEDPATKDYLQIFGVHGYNDDGITSDGGNAPKAHELRDKLKGYGREIWMTESSGEDQTWQNKPWGALGLGWMIHNTLANGDASAYVYWQITHGAKQGKSKETLMTDDRTSPKYYAFKHFSKFIRPGAVRVDTNPTNKDGLAASAYLHQANGTLSIVLLNGSNHDISVKLHVKGSPVTDFDTFRSTASESCKEIGKATLADDVISLDMPAESMVTLYGHK